MTANAGAFAASNTSAANAARSQYDLAFQICPIFLQGGIAANTQGGILPIIALYGQLSLYQNMATARPGAPPFDTSAFFARYVPLPGSTLISNQAGTYPYANVYVAANAIIQQPLSLSMMMIAPVNQQSGYAAKLATFTGLVASLTNHNAAGGWYSVATSANIYGPLIMLNMADATHTESQQQQIMYQIDFTQPLLTLPAASAVQNNLMSGISNGQQLSNPPLWSGNPQAQVPATAMTLGALQNSLTSNINVVGAIA